MTIRTLDISHLLRKAVGGDVAALDGLERFSHDAMLAASRSLELELEPEVVARVLNAYRMGAISAEAAQRWASFVRRGHLPDTSSGPSRPIEINYQVAKEDAIVEAIARLDELGDLIDGEIDDEEAAKLLRELRAPRSNN